MHLVLDATVVQPPFTGVQNAVREQVRAMLRTPQTEARFTVLTCDPALAEDARTHGADTPGLPRFCQRKLGRVAWQQLSLPSLLRRLNADGLHALAYTAPHRCPVPCAVNIHDLIPFERPELCELRNRAHMRLLMPRSVARAWRLVASSTPVASVLKERFGVDDERIEVIPLGVDGARFSPDAARPTCTPDAPYVLFVGTVEPKKGLPTLLRAWPTIRREHPDTTLLLCGRKGWHARNLTTTIRGLRNQGVVWLREVGNDELPGLYAHAAACLVPSTIEGFGLTVLEAMAAGAPVVHSDIPVLHETAGGAAAEFATGDPRELARVAIELLNQEARRTELVARGKERAHALPWSRWAERALAMWQTRPEGRASPSRGEPRPSEGAMPDARTLGH